MLVASALAIASKVPNPASVNTSFTFGPTPSILVKSSPLVVVFLDQAFDLAFQAVH